MQSNRPRNTILEVQLRSALHRRGLRFRKHVRPVSGVRCEADIAFPSRRVAVFVDGCFWHGCPVHATWPMANGDFWRKKIEGTIARDTANRSTLASASWLVVALWEHETVEQMVRQVEIALTGKRAPAAELSGRRG
jgi:DNA mismatch endonuclease (patch repair protein)